MKVSELEPIVVAAILVVAAMVAQDGFSAHFADEAARKTAVQAVAATPGAFAPARSVPAHPGR